MDMATFAMGCMSYENQRNQGNLPEHDQEFQAETGIGPVYNMGRPQTRQEQREALEEDGRMTHDEIEEWLDSLEMQRKSLTFTNSICILQYNKGEL